MKKKFSAAVAVLLLATMVTAAYAQVSYPNSWFTSYQIANLGDDAAIIHVDYYDETGVSDPTMSRDFPDVTVGGSVTILQSVEDTLDEGVWSAVVSADQPIAAVVNQQTAISGDLGSIPPFSSYSGASEGATEVMVPSVMYNWFGYYTEIVIQNVGTTDAVDIDIEYFPTTYGGCLAGATGQSDVDMTLAQYAGQTVSQVAMTKLGASGLTGDCAYLNGRFLGSAKITADQDIAVVVNEHVQNKLFTYNGFPATGATNIVLPAYMRNYYGYYAAMVIANPGTVTATVTVTYTNGALGNSPAGQEVVVGTHEVPAGENITIYDGETGDDTDLALAGYDYASTYSFFGTAEISSDEPVVALVNQEAVAASGAQAGSYNGAAAATEGSAKISVPLIQSAFYGYYTSLTIMTVDGGEATLNITYTSDDTYSTVQGHSETYNHTTTNGFLNRYEGPSLDPSLSDVLSDAAWESGGYRRFIGSAVIEVVSGSNIVAFVNSEYSAPGIDSMYTYNAFSQ